MIAHNHEMTAKAAATQVADLLELELKAILDHGFGKVTVEISVVNGTIPMIRCSEEKTFKPNLN